MAVITISCGTKSGGLKLAQHLAEKLGYKTISHEVISECSKKYNIMEQDLLEELENSPGLWQRLTQEYNRQLIYIKCTLLEMIKEDNIIYHGYAGPLFLTGLDNVFKLRLETPMEDRINTVMNELKKNHEEALEYINGVDGQRSRWVKLLYDEDWRNPLLFDLSVNSQHLSFDTICDIVVVAVNGKDFQTSEMTARRLANLSLACEVKAAIAADNKIWNQPITVGAEDGVVTLKGTVKNQALKDLIIETAEQVKGVKSCNAVLGLLTDGLPMGKYDHK